MKRTSLISSRFCCRCIPIFILLTWMNETVNAQAQPRAAFRDRVVDLIILNDQTRLYGAPIASIPDGFVFRTKWLKSEAAEFYAKYIEPGLLNVSKERLSADVRERLQLEAQRLRQIEPPDLRKIGQIMEVLDRQQAQGQYVGELVVIVFPRSIVRRHQPQSIRNRQLGLLAFLNHVDEPETCSWQHVARQLTLIAPATLKTSLPDPHELTPDAQFLRIMAAIDYRSRTCLSFVSTGNRLIPDGADVQIPALMAEMLSDSIRKQLERLVSEESAATLQSADRREAALIQLVEQAGISALAQGTRTMAVSEYDIAPQMNAAEVRRSLFAADDRGKWQIMNRASATASLADITPAQAESVAADPQVRQITELVGGLLGSVGSADGNAIDQAVRLGAVVQLAGKRSESVFEEQLTQVLNADPSISDMDRIPVIHIDRQLRLPPMPQ